MQQVAEALNSLMMFLRSLPPPVLWVSLIALITAAFVLLLTIVMLIWKRSREKTVEEITEKVVEEIAQRIRKREEKEKEKGRKKEEVRKKNKLKARRKYIVKELDELEKKQATMGLTKKEIIRKKAYEEELLRIEEDLLKNEAFLDELDEKAEEILLKARLGVPSRSIRRELQREGYTKKEIGVIRKLFEMKKAENTGRKT